MFQLSKEDLPVLESEIERFIQQAIKPAFAQPESPLNPEALHLMIQKLLAQGVLGSSDEAFMGLWGEIENPVSRWLSLKILILLGEVNPSLAYQAHQEALSEIFFTTPFKRTENRSRQLIMQGHQGMGRFSLARYLCQQITEEDSDVLKDHYHFSSHQPGLLWSHLLPEQLLVPVWSPSGVIQFAEYAQEDLTVECLPPSHGLSELQTFQWFPKSKAKPIGQTQWDVSTSKTHLQTLLCLHWQGLLAIATGAVRKSYQLARDFANTRRQGGCQIVMHPAVRQLLHRAYFSANATYDRLSQLAHLSLNTKTLLATAQARAHDHRLLSQGANDALQVLGGMGYMQDLGLEKCVRDVMQLRLLAGSPMELELFCSELELS